MFMEVAVRILLGLAYFVDASEGLSFLFDADLLQPPEEVESLLKKELDRFWDSSAVPLSALRIKLPPLEPLKKVPDAKLPTKAEVMQAVPSLSWAFARREGLTFKAEKLAEVVGAPRFVPLVGPSHLREVRWKCTVAYNLVVEIGTGPKYRVAIPRSREVTVETVELILRNIKKD